MWRCKDTNKYTEHMSLRIKWCEDTSLQASSHQPGDMGTQGCEPGHMHLRIWGYKNSRIKQASTHKHKDVKMQDARIWTSQTYQ